MLAEAIAETNPQTAKQAAQKELETCSPQEGRPMLDALSKIEAKSQAEARARASRAGITRLSGTAEHRADRSGRESEDGISSVVSPAFPMQGPFSRA